MTLMVIGACASSTGGGIKVSRLLILLKSISRTIKEMLHPKSCLLYTSLEKAAKEKNCYIRIETRGSGGAKNVLTAKEIEEADCIIVAADTQVPMDRFDGKKVIECQVSDGISRANELVEQAIAGNVPVYHGQSGTKAVGQPTKKSGGVGHQIYAQLMNGVSHMLPFVVGGGRCV